MSHPSYLCGIVETSGWDHTFQKGDCRPSSVGATDHTMKSIKILVFGAS